MRSLTASELLAVWDRAAGEHPVDRALTLLCACCGETRQELAALSLGQRDGRLLAIYERLFGSRMEAFAACPQCGERLEYSMSTQALASRQEPSQETPLALQLEKTTLHLRLPNSLDLFAASGCSDAGAARQMLLERCVEVQGGPGMQAETLPEATIEKIASCLAQADPNAETLIDLTCCACRHGWQVLLDIEAFLWVKITAAAKRLLREVYSLARAYGWREQDILALTPRRRHAYLEMAQSWLTF